MIDPRIEKLADILIGYSCAVKPGDNVLLESFDIPDEVVAVLIKRIAAAGGKPFASTKRNAVLRALYDNATEEQMELTGKFEASRMTEMQAYIGLRGSLNISEFSDVPSDKMKLYRQFWWHPVHTERRVKHTRWVVLRYPSASMAQQASMSTEQFEDFYFKVCTFDYSKLDAAMHPLKDLMERTDRVRLVGPSTDLAFSIKGLPALPCTGDRNIPDGECYTAPVRDSINGLITYNAPTVYQGTVFEGIALTFENGKIIEATASGGNTGLLNQILDTDEGARYVGEFSLGLNPYILEPMKDILFDEKIAGSFHFTPGCAYDECDNGNRSAVHWDMVMLQRAEQGGGEIYFDDVLVRKDGLFVIPELEHLNPEELKRV